MNHVVTAALAIGLLVSTSIAADKSAAPELKDNKDKAGYAIGLNIGRAMKRDGGDINPEAIALGVRDALAAAKQRLTDEELAAAMEALQRDLMARRAAGTAAAEADAKKSGEKNKKAGEDFLAANKKKDGVKTTASGLQYKVIKDGTGESPKATDSVTTHYRGTLIDGTEFDSSYKRNEPTSFPVNRVIKGWTEALQLMKEGSKWQLFIPSDLAYGPGGAGDLIGPNSALVFEVELIKVQAGQ